MIQCIQSRISFRTILYATLFSFCMTLIYWFFREVVPTEDGDRIWRMVEGGVWFYRRSLLAQAIARGIYVCVSPFGWNGVDALHLYSVLSGGFFVFISVLTAYLLPYSSRWPLFLLLTAGFGRIFCGHVEYYALVAAATALYLFVASLVLQERISVGWAALAYSFLCWTHLMGLFLFPSLLVLWIVTGGKRSGLRELAFGLIPLGLIFVFLRGAHWLGVDLHGQLYGQHLLRLFDVGDTGMYYPLFSRRHFREWGKIQIVCGAMFWPLLFIALSRRNFVLIVRNRYLLFFSSVWLLYLGYSLVWHIDLGPENDWDLFAPGFVPMAWLVGVLLHLRRFSRPISLVLIGAVLVSLLPVIGEAANHARIGMRGKGDLWICGWEETPVEIYFDGRPRGREITGVRMGEHELRVLAKERKSTHRQTVGIIPNTTVRVVLPPLTDSQENPGQP
ncbi:MAG TPA: hypothetical protein PLQ35_13235 [bacterium]|nr:hypothetical protein [bacterium]HQL63249.1 hypothetical protein [bacterium]